MILILILTVLIFIMSMFSFFLFYSKIVDDEDVRYAVLVVLAIIMTMCSFISSIKIFQEVRPPEQKYIDCLQKTPDNQELKNFCKNTYLK